MCTANFETATSIHEPNTNFYAHVSSAYTLTSTEQGTHGHHHQTRYGPPGTEIARRGRKYLYPSITRSHHDAELARLARQARPGVEELQTIFPQDVAGDQNIALAELFHPSRRDGNLPDLDLSRILNAAGIDDPPEVGPKTRGKAHRARFARRIDGRAGQVQLLQLTTRGSDGLDFAMRSSVDIRLRAVMRDSQDFAFVYDTGAEWHLALPHPLPRGLNRHSHEVHIRHSRVLGGQ